VTGRRYRALLALVLYAGTGIAAPLADGLLDHLGGQTVSHHHIEGTDGGDPCHNQRCLLDRPVTPQTVARVPIVPIGLGLVRRQAVRLADPTQHLDRRPSHSLRPRAPPRSN
jgi:hypothetical protein